MVRLLATLRWRHVRWAACAAVIPALWACYDRKLAAPVGGLAQVVQKSFMQTVNRDLDILFMVDNSSSMKPLQTKMAMQLPVFMDVLKTLPGGQPNLHVAVISSSLGAGLYGNVTGCSRPSGDQEGLFQHQASCAGLHTGETYLSSVAGATSTDPYVNNFDTDIATVFSCIAQLGQTGCGFEHQFASTMAALQRASTPGDPNYGFLRPKAYLAIVMLTNEDDSSTPLGYQATLFNPGVDSVADPSGLGPLQSWRSNEYGHLCGTPPMPPPHLPPPAAGITLTGCTSSEGMSPSVSVSGAAPNLVVSYGPPDPNHQELTVAEFVNFLKALKANPDTVLVAALAGPATPYTVVPTTTQLGSTGGTETQPSIAHSCMQNSGEYADPGVRIKNWLDAFGGNGVFETICAPDFSPAMKAIATAIGQKLTVQCVTGTVETKAGGSGLDCDITSVHTVNGKDTPTTVVQCPPDGSAAGATLDAPCWRLTVDPMACPAAGTVPNKRLDICYDPTCATTIRPTAGSANASVSCALCPSGTVPPGAVEPPLARNATTCP